MNKVYKVVWNASLKTCIVVGELSNNKLTTGALTASPRALRAGLVLALLPIFLTSPAQAVGYSAGTGANAGTNDNAVAVGNSATINGNVAGTAIGGGATAGGTPTLATQRRTDGLGDFNITNASSSTAVGTASSATGGGATAIGSNNIASNALSTALGVANNSSGASSTAIGVANTASGNTAISLGRMNVASGDYSAAIGNTATATGSGALAFGNSASSTANGAIAIGSSTANTNLQDSTTNTRASGANSVALGANAVASQANAIAIGATATASNANSVALGNGSVTAAAHTGSFVIGGSAAGTASGVVSVGAIGAERQIQNVAPGVLSAASTDAINGSQLFATNNQVNTNTGNIATNTANIATNTANIAGNTSSITNLSNGTVGLVKQDQSTQAITVAGDKAGTSVSIAGAAGSRTLTGVTAGALNGTSTDAVNGSQLFATNNQVATNTGNIATNTANIAGNTTSINNLTNGTVGLVKQDQSTQAITVAGDKAGTSVSVAGTAGSRTLTGVTAGALNGTSTDAVNGSQLFATNNQVATNTGNIATNTANIAGNTTSINNLTNGTVGLVKQDPTSQVISVAGDKAGTSVNVAGTAGSRTLTGVTAGALNGTSTDAVNGSQLFATNANVTANTAKIATNTTNLGNVASSLGGGAGIAADGTWTAPDYAVQGGNYANVGAALGALDTATTGNSTAITNLQTQLNEGAVGLVKQDATTREISVAAATDGTSVTFANASGASRTLSGVADGELSATSNQAVNGSQLFATNANVTANTAKIATNTTNLGNVASSLGGGAGIAADGTWTAPDYAVQGGNYANVGAALGALDTATTGNSTAITNLQTQLNEGAVGLVKQDATTREISVAAATDGTSVTFANASGASRTLSGVADGELSATSNQAVNGSQLFATNANVTANTAKIATNTTNLGNVASSLGGSAGIAADGTWTAPDYAVQGGNYHNVGDALSTLDTATTGNSTAISNLQTQLNEGAVGLVKQDATTREISVAATTDGTSVTFANASGASRTLSGVAKGELSATSNQAVNGSQLFATNANVTANTAKIATNTTNLGNVASSLGGGAGIAADGTWTAPDYGVQGGNYHNVGDALSALDVATTGNSTAISNLQTEINNGGLGLVKQDPTTRDITVAAATDGDLVTFTNSAGDTRTLSGVTAALLSSTSTQAVNGSQLYAANNTIVNILGGSAALDGNGNITGPTWTIQGTTTNNISQALASLDSSVNDLKRDAQSGGGKIVTQPGTKDAVSVGGHTGGTSVSLTGQDGDRTLTGVANGVKDNDAVTVAQLNALSREVVAASKQLAVNVSDGVTPASATGADSIALGGNANSSGTNAISIGNGSAASGSGSSAVGASSSASGANATAMGQNSNASGANSVALGSNSVASGSNSVALGANSVASRDNSVSVGAAGSERQITNVAAGTQSTDAVNLGQLNSAQQQNNRAFSQLSRRIDRVENKLTAGIASSMAMAGIPQAYQPDSNLVGAAISGYSDKSAIAVGVSKISENGRWITKLQASANTESDVGASIGVGYQW